MLVSFTGRKGHGKTTAAQVLIDAGFVHLNFADPVREVCQIVYGLSLEEMCDAELKEIPLTRWPFKSPRELMTEIGTEVFRKRHADIFCRVFDRRYRELVWAGSTKVVCSDVRFLNEAGLIIEHQGFICRVVDPRKPKFDQHVSETEMDRIRPDLTFNNAAGVADLRANVAAHFLNQ